MTLANFIAKFKNVRTTTVGLIALAVGTVFLVDAASAGASIPWEFVGLCGLVGLLGLNSLDGGL
jgi:hypothetical protein